LLCDDYAPFVVLSRQGRVGSKGAATDAMGVHCVAAERSYQFTAAHAMNDKVRRSPARQRYRYRRRHTPHYYIVSTGISAAALVSLLNAIAYATRSIALANAAFVAVLFASLAVFTGYFWGFFMVMSGNIPVKRLKVLIPHAAVGTLAPLLYTLNVSIAVDGLGVRPVSMMSVVGSALSLILLCVQFVMGKAIVRPQPLRIVRESVADS
jgi:hypothetical protein